MKMRGFQTSDDGKDSGCDGGGAWWWCWSHRYWRWCRVRALTSFGNVSGGDELRQMLSCEEFWCWLWLLMTVVGFGDDAAGRRCNLDERRWGLGNSTMYRRMWWRYSWCLVFSKTQLSASLFLSRPLFYPPPPPPFFDSTKSKGFMEIEGFGLRLGLKVWIG